MPDTDPAFDLPDALPVADSAGISARLALAGAAIGLLPTAYRRLVHGKGASTGKRTATEAAIASGLFASIPWLARPRFRYSVPNTYKAELTKREGETPEAYNSRYDATRIRSWDDVRDRLLLPREATKVGAAPWWLKPDLKFGVESAGNKLVGIPAYLADKVRGGESYFTQEAKRKMNADTKEMGTAASIIQGGGLAAAAALPAYAGAKAVKAVSPFFKAHSRGIGRFLYGTQLVGSMGESAAALNASRNAQAINEGIDDDPRREALADSYHRERKGHLAAAIGLTVPFGSISGWLGKRLPAYAAATALPLIGPTLGVLPDAAPAATALGYADAKGPDARAKIMDPNAEPIWQDRYEDRFRQRREFAKARLQRTLARRAAGDKNWAPLIQNGKLVRR